MGEWICYIATDAELVRPSPRTITNPFKNAPYVWTPRDDQVEVRVRGVIVGRIEASPEFEDDGELDVYSADSHGRAIRSAVLRIAATLSATVTWRQAHG